MTETPKRIITSFFLMFLLLVSINNILILAIIVLLIFYQIIYEFHIIFKKIFSNREKYKQFFMFSLILIYITFFSFKILEVFYINNPELKFLFYLIISICIATDIGGYVFGKFFKGKKLTKISPNKTYSGLIGSYVLAVIFNLLLFNNIFENNRIILVAIVISTISQLGDLFISLLKRKAKIKDTGVILPGHGGLLDRFDGLIFAIPIGILLFSLWKKVWLF